MLREDQDLEELFQKIPVELPNQPSPKKNENRYYMLLGGGWYVKKEGQKISPLNKSIFKKIPKRGGWNKEKNLPRLINILIIGNFRYTWINLSGLIQGVAMNGKIHFVCLLKRITWLLQWEIEKYLGISRKNECNIENISS